MTDQEVLRKALNEIDSYRYRWQWSFGVMAAISQIAWTALAFGTRNASDRTLILMAAVAVACTVFGGVFLLVLQNFRMTHKILTAIEVASRQN